MESRSRQHAPPAVPGYEIMSFLGAGGTSTVWLARQLSLDRVVAIKVLSPALLTDDTAREQFKPAPPPNSRIRPLSGSWI